MRRILVESARRKMSLRRGGNLRRHELNDPQMAVPPRSDDLLALDEALDRLARRDKIKAELVKLPYFAGLTGAQAASALGISTTTADRYWAYARAWLHLLAEVPRPTRGRTALRRSAEPECRRGPR